MDQNRRANVRVAYLSPSTRCSTEIQDHVSFPDQLVFLRPGAGTHTFIYTHTKKNESIDASSHHAAVHIEALTVLSSRSFNAARERSPSRFACFTIGSFHCRRTQRALAFDLPLRLLISRSGKTHVLPSTPPARR